MSAEVLRSLPDKQVADSRFKIEFASELTKFEDPNGALQQMDELISAGAFPLFVANHNRTFNMYTFNMVAERLEHMPQTTYMMIAETLLTGHQGERAQYFTEGFAEVLKENNIEFLPIWRGEPDHKYVTNPDERPAFERRSKRAMIDFLGKIEDSTGLMIFAEGGINGGRMKPLTEYFLPWGRRRGTQEVTDKTVPTIVKRLKRVGREVAVLPISNVRSYRLIPEKRRGPTALDIGLYGLRKVGFDVHASSVVVQEPITFKDFDTAGIDLNDSEAVNRAIFEIIVDPLPKNDRGDYK